MIRHDHPAPKLPKPGRWWSRDLTKTFTYLAVHLAVGFSVAYLLTGSVAIASGIALIEPAVNAVAFYFHERFWKRIEAKESATTPTPPPAGGRTDPDRRVAMDGFDPWVLHPTPGHRLRPNAPPEPAPRERP